MDDDRKMLRFKSFMVPWVKSGRKRQTRRIADGVVAVHSRTGEALADIDSAGPRVCCPYGQPGERIPLYDEFGIQFGVGVVDAVRVERVQSISEADAEAEGVAGVDHGGGMDYGGKACYTRPFRALWEQVYGASQWEENPWVWVLTISYLRDATLSETIGCTVEQAIEDARIWSSDVVERPDLHVGVGGWRVALAVLLEEVDRLRVKAKDVG